jgi:hypothetical protein
LEDTIEEIQRAYLAELRGIAPEIQGWWSGLLARDGEEAVWLRWPTGPSSHPRVLAIFRKYYFRIEELNRLNIVDFSDDEIRPESMWGRDDLGNAALFEKHVNRLILDIPVAAPDVAHLVDGICFVPVGIDHKGAPV